MLYRNEQLYKECCALKKGLRKLSPCLEALRTRLSECLGIGVLNLVYETGRIGAAKGRPSLNVIVESGDDYRKIIEPPFKVRSAVEDVILRQFAEIVGQMGLQDQFDTATVLLCSDNFSEEAMNQAARLLFYNDREGLIERFSSDGIWDIAAEFKEIVVFFTNEEAKDSALATGTGEQIRRACFEVVKRYDEFNYITPENFTVIFDSKENFDRNYEGNLFYYFK